MEMIKVHADVGMVDGFVDLIFLLVHTEMLTLIACIWFHVQQLFAGGH